MFEKTISILMAENIKVDRYLSKVKSVKSLLLSHKQTLILGMSSALTGGAAYSYIISLDYHYFTPAVGIVAGLIGGLGMAAVDTLSEKETFDKDIPLRNIALYVLFGITALILGYIFVYYFVKLPGIHGEFIRPAEVGRTINDFFRETMGRLDIIGAVLGSISSSGIPVIFRKRLKNILKKLSFSRFY